MTQITDGSQPDLFDAIAREDRAFLFAQEVFRIVSQAGRPEPERKSDAALLRATREKNVR